LSALGLIYQAYQLSFSLQSMLLIGFVLMLPVVYLLDGYYLAVLYLIGICWAGWGGDYTLMVLFLTGPGSNEALAAGCWDCAFSSGFCIWPYGICRTTPITPAC
jgi:hypothetical protein